MIIDVQFHCLKLNENLKWGELFINHITRMHLRTYSFVNFHIAHFNIVHIDVHICDSSCT